MAQKINVTAEQARQIETAWELCAWPGKRVINDSYFVRSFNECVTDILGFAPPDEFTVVVEAA